MYVRSQYFTLNESKNFLFYIKMNCQDFVQLIHLDSRRCDSKNIVQKGHISGQKENIYVIIIQSGDLKKKAICHFALI